MNKRIAKPLSLLLCIFLLCSIFSGCNNSNTKIENNTAQAYLDMAQDYIASGNYDLAIDVLKKGYSNTGDERINALLQEALSSQSSTSTTTPAVTIPSTTAPITTAPSNTSTFLNTHGGSITISSANISLQDSDVLYVTLSFNGSVSYSCEPQNIITLTWGEFDHTNTVPLYITAQQNGSAKIRIYETNYPNNYLTITVTVSNHVTIDTSKASGILAQAGLTEQEFRDMCQPLVQHSYVSMYGSITGPTVGRLDLYHVAYGKQYYAEHPEDTNDETAAERWLKIETDYLSGGNNYTDYYGYGNYSSYHQYTKYLDLNTYLLHTVYAPKGEALLEKSTSALFEIIEEYPNDYIGMPFVFLDFDFDSIVGTAYTDNNYSYNQVTIYDLRDDINSPNIIKNNSYCLYTIFEGTYTDYNGDIVLIFSLLSLEKCE